MNNQKNVFSTNLNKLVAQSNLPQSEIAKRIGVSPQTFNTWMQGIAIPRMGKIQLLADYFNINKSDLIEDKSEDKSEKDIALMVDNLLSELNSSSSLMYSGEPMDELSKMLVREALEQSARMVYAIHKERKLKGEFDGDKENI